MAKEKNKRQDKEKGKTPIMNTKLFEYILQIVKNITDLCNKAADAADSDEVYVLIFCHNQLSVIFI